MDVLLATSSMSTSWRRVPLQPSTTPLSVTASCSMGSARCAATMRTWSPAITGPSNWSTTYTYFVVPWSQLAALDIAFLWQPVNEGRYGLCYVSANQQEEARRILLCETFRCSAIVMPWLREPSILCVTFETSFAMATELISADAQLLTGTSSFHIPLSRATATWTLHLPGRRRGS